MNVGVSQSLKCWRINHIRIFGLMVMMLALLVLTGCGSRYVRKVEPLKETQSVGILANYTLTAPGKWTGVLGGKRYSEENQAAAREAATAFLKEGLEEKGLKVKVVDRESPEGAALVKAYFALSRTVITISDPDDAKFGDQSQLFTVNGIDRLLFFDALSILQSRPSFTPVALASIGTLLTGGVIVSAQPNSTTYTYFSEINRDGTFDYHDETQFIKEGDYNINEHRAGFFRYAISTWLEETRKK